ncbi:MAG TPA: glycosyl hydrolase family 18 protein [Chloroflexota bacterium]
MRKARAGLARWLWPGLFVAGALLMAAAAPASAGQLRPVAPPRALLEVPPPATPTPSPASGPILRWAYMVGSSIPASLRDHADQIDVLAPAWFHANADGTLSGSDSPAVSQFARAHGIKLVPIVANGDFQQSVAHSLVSDGNRQTQLLNSLQWLVSSFGYDGVNVDFENLAGADRALFSGLMSNVYARLHPIGKLVTIALPPKTSESFTGFSGGFDYAAIAPSIDLALVMAYDQHFSGGPAGPIADVAWVNDVLNYAQQQIPANHILLGVPFYGYNWNLFGCCARSMTYNDVVSTVFSTGAQIQMDAASLSPHFSYGDHRVWFENSTSLKAKLDLVGSHGLAGWGGWRLGQEDPNFWTMTLQPSR